MIALTRPSAENRTTACAAFGSSAYLARPPTCTQPPADTADADLRPYLLSHRLVQPNSMKLDGIFNILPSVCWTSLGPVAVSDIDTVRPRALAGPDP